jgi:hypothetical protein
MLYHVTTAVVGWRQAASLTVLPFELVSQFYVMAWTPDLREPISSGRQYEALLFCSIALSQGDGLSATPVPTWEGWLSGSSSLSG